MYGPITTLKKYFTKLLKNHCFKGNSTQVKWNTPGAHLYWFCTTCTFLMILLCLSFTLIQMSDSSVSPRRICLMPWQLHLIWCGSPASGLSKEKKNVISVCKVFTVNINTSQVISPPKICPNILWSIQSQGLRFTGNKPVVVRMMMSTIERHSLLNAWLSTN